MTDENRPETEATAEAAPTKSPRSRFYTAVTRLVHALDPRGEGALGLGDLASLRREDGARSPTFYKLSTALLHDELSDLHGERLDEVERRWARVTHLLARTGGQHRNDAASFGAALAQAELAEARFLRLLRAEGDAVDAAARAALAPLVQKATTFQPVDLAALVLSAPHPTWRFHFEDAELVRRRIARDFYRTLASSNANA